MRHRLQNVARELLLSEKVVGLILIETANYVIAVAPGVIAKPISFEALAFGKADDIEPVPPPTFALVG